MVVLRLVVGVGGVDGCCFGGFVGVGVGGGVAVAVEVGGWWWWC